jgi:hypothetical protein
VREEVLRLYELKSVQKLIVVKDVLPHAQPIKSIRNFINVCKYFLFPFVQITQGDGAEESEADQSERDLNGGD